MVTAVIDVCLTMQSLLAWTQTHGFELLFCLAFFFFLLTYYFHALSVHVDRLDLNSHFTYDSRN